MISMLLGAFVAALLVSAIACGVALQLFPWFRSGERKVGDFRPDQSGGNSELQVIVPDNAKSRLRRPVRVRSSELPLVGGAAMLAAVVIASVAAGFFIGLNTQSWELLSILMLAMLGFGLIGFLDDARKVYYGEGITERQKGIGVVLVSLAAAIALNRFVIEAPLSARIAYSPYVQLPLLGPLLVHAHFAWIAFFLLLSVIVTSSAALAVDFADGMDGLGGGLLLSAGLAYAVILLDQGGAYLWPMVIALLALAGATAGFLPFNWPSSWRGGATPKGKRRAKLIMGDTGSLALGGLLALVAIVTRLELLLIIIGGAFVLEGVSALVSARILVRFFRYFLFLERYQSGRGFPHTELPLPFLATPMHHHYDLLSVDRKRLVYGAWLLGAGLGLLGIASVVAPFTWERYLARLAGLAILVAIWQAGPWTRTFFIGLTPTQKNAPNAPRYLALYYGAPFRLFGRNLYGRVDVTNVTEDALQEPNERLSLWQRMGVFDARSLLGYYCYRANELDDAMRIWDRIPNPNLRQRPEITQMLSETRHHIALETVGSSAPLSRITGAPEPVAPPTGDYDNAQRDQAGYATGDMPVHPRLDSDLNASAWHMPVPPTGIGPAPRLQPVHDGQPAPGASAFTSPRANPNPNSNPPSTFGRLDEAQLWSATSWRAATGGPALTGTEVPAVDLSALTAPTDQQSPVAPGAPSAQSSDQPDMEADTSAATYIPPQELPPISEIAPEPADDTPTDDTAGVEDTTKPRIVTPARSLSYPPAPQASQPAESTESAESEGQTDEPSSREELVGEALPDKASTPAVGERPVAEVSVSSSTPGARLSPLAENSGE
ncbi:MAG: hypothetical protein ABI068_03095 [Ktedonobacterales bacterium]